MIKIISPKFTILIIVIFFSSIIKFSALANENKILLKVNNELITTIDILNEISYLKSINRNISNLEKRKVIEIARNSLIKDKIKIIALTSVVDNFEISDDDFKRILISNYSGFGYTKIEEIYNHLKNYKIKIKLIRNKMAINAIWSQFIYDKYSRNIKIDIDKLKQGIQKSENQTEYLLSEIVFNLNEKQTIDEKIAIIENAIQKNGFENTALIYSISETSTSGGSIGWVSENSINKKILNEITKININDFTKPLVIPGGYLILKLHEKKITERDVNIEDELKKIIETKTNEQLNQFSNIFLNKVRKDIVINEL
tara:strand:- start:2380 stop:3321 length:942 start_codon:yes stop_codon:yes gene_type:complete